MQFKHATQNFVSKRVLFAKSFENNDGTLQLISSRPIKDSNLETSVRDLRASLATGGQTGSSVVENA